MGWKASNVKQTVKKNFTIERTKSFITSSEMMFRNLYVIEPTVIGGGSFGKVFRGHSTSDKKYKVAIKVINKEKVKTNVDYIKQEWKSLK